MIASGRSFREELTRLRLDACRAALADPYRSGETIAEIAFSAGFNDLSQFNRHFRSAFGATPSQARGIPAGQGGEPPIVLTRTNGRTHPPEPVQ
jgi:transcriptional regulator GlxA family with amidase domain